MFLVYCFFLSSSEEYVIILEEGLEAFNFQADESLLGIALLDNIVNASGLFRFLYINFRLYNATDWTEYFCEPSFRCEIVHLLLWMLYSKYNFSI